MNKVFILILLSSIFTLAEVYSRTWTSADGQQTFEGKLRSYNKETGNVKVIKGMKQFSFHVDILSEADRAWLETQVSDREEKNDGGAKVLEELGKQVIGAKLKEGVLSKLEGSKFVDYTMSFAPKYYLVYFSASW